MRCLVTVKLIEVRLPVYCHPIGDPQCSVGRWWVGGGGRERGREGGITVRCSCSATWHWSSVNLMGTVLTVTRRMLMKLSHYMCSQKDPDETVTLHLQTEGCWWNCHTTSADRRMLMKLSHYICRQKDPDETVTLHLQTEGSWWNCHTTSADRRILMKLSHYICRQKDPDETVTLHLQTEGSWWNCHTTCAARRTLMKLS